MEIDADRILAHLSAVAMERRAREANPVLGQRVTALKRYQQRRLEATYRDLLDDSRYAGACRFFLDDLYGPTDFADRDAQFARIVPAIVRLFPAEIVETVRDLAELHALSETLDTAMAEFEPTTRTWDRHIYARAWQAIGRREARQRQVDLTFAVGASLDRLTRRKLLWNALRFMGPAARAAGLGALQAFLETGFVTFRQMNGANEFLARIRDRECRFAGDLFSADATRWIEQQDDVTLSRCTGLSALP